MKCNNCKSKNVIKKGWRKNIHGKKQMFKCKDCKHLFVEKDNRFKHDKETKKLVIKEDKSIRRNFSILNKKNDREFEKEANSLKKTYDKNIKGMKKWRKTEEEYFNKLYLICKKYGRCNYYNFYKYSKLLRYKYSKNEQTSKQLKPIKILRSRLLPIKYNLKIKYNINISPATISKILKEYDSNS